MSKDNYYDFEKEISTPASHMASHYLRLHGNGEFPIDPELIAEHFFGLRVAPFKGIYKNLGVIAGIDSTQSLLFIDEDIYNDDKMQHIARQAMAHELGHIVYDSPMLRSNAPQTALEAFRVHSQMKANGKIETRANMFAGALLAPRNQLLTEAGNILSRGIADLMDSNPNMTVGRVFEVLSGDKLARKFGVSNEVIDWRLRNEKFLELLELKAETPLKDVDSVRILELCSIEAEKQLLAIPVSVLRLLPEAFLKLI